jgi:MFS family permease
MASDARSVKQALRFVGLLGLVSLFADLTYEGARSITGPFLAALGASSLVVGFAAGLGEFAGYALRLLTGLAADRTRRYWLFTFVGYAINLGAVPALALANRWEWAVVLMVAERLGKAVRTPARDALLSRATASLGHGKGFGLHELLDQIGAVGGPLLVAWVLAKDGGFARSFLILGIPAAASLVTLAVARWVFPSATFSEQTQAFRQAPGGFPRELRWVLFFVALHLLGFAHFQLVAYHCQVQGIFPTATIPLLFALAMAVDGVLALPVGALFDRLGLGSLQVGAVLAVPVTALAFSHAPGAVALGIALWGAAMAMQETILKAAIAATSPQEGRGFAFGLYHAVAGCALLAGNALFGALYPLGYWALLAFSATMQLAALGVLRFALRPARKER